VKPRHRGQVRGQSLTLARLDLLDEKIHGLLDNELGLVVLLRRPSLIGRVAAVTLCRIFLCGAAGMLAASLLVVLAGLLTADLLRFMTMLLW
jgi:hypothetical protein